MILNSFEQQDKIYILYYENKEIIDDLFDYSSNNDEINLEGLVEGHSLPIKKREINNILEKEISICKIRNENKIGTGFFCRINIDDIPFKLALFSNNHILDRNSIKPGKEIVIEHKNISTYKILEITKDRRTFTDEELDYTCIEIFEDDKIFKNNEIEQLFKIDHNILEENISSLLNNDIFILQYPEGNEFSFSVGKIDYIDNKLIKHTASTIGGSSGSPIIKRNNYSIIGIHFGGKKKENNIEYIESNLSTNVLSILNDIKIKTKNIKLNKNNEQNKEKEIKREVRSNIMQLKERESESSNTISEIDVLASIKNPKAPKYGTTILTNLEDYKKFDKLGIIKYKSKHFVLANTIDIIYKCSGNFGAHSRLKAEIVKLKNDFEKQNFYYEGFQIYGIIDEKLIGVMEGPPNTSYEKGFFLFQIIIDKDYPLSQGNKFFFKTKIFHPNVADDGLLSLTKDSEVFEPIMSFPSIILAIQSLLDEPNTDIFLNEKAAKLYKENRIKYEETVKKYTFQYANFLNLQNELSKYKLNIKHMEK